MKKFTAFLLTTVSLSALAAGGVLFFERMAPSSGEGLNSVYAETAISPSETAESSLVTLPITQLSHNEPVYETISFTFLGDCILASNEGDARTDSFTEIADIAAPQYFFEKALPYYENSDFVVANSEFVISDDTLAKTEKEGTAFWFKAPVSRTEILKAAGIDIVTIANNHTGDYGDKGYEDTKAALDEAGILWGDSSNVVYVKKNGITFSIICSKLFSTNFDPIITPLVEEAAEKSDIQILFFHGGTENEHAPEDWLTELCHKYADMGVDLIVGSHPHVLRPFEEYKDTDIIYSLGNFCYGGNRTPENRTVVFTESFVFDEDGNYLDKEENIIPFYVYSGSHNNWQPAPIIDSQDYSRTMAFMYGKIDMPQ